MIGRRAFVCSGAAFALIPVARSEWSSRLVFRGSMEQGGLVLGHVPAGTLVTVDETPVQVSSNGIFCIGLTYDALQPTRVYAQFSDGRSETRDLLATPREYEVQAIDGLPQNYVEPPPEIVERIMHERELVWEARKRETEGTDFANGLEWPFAGIVSSRYGNQRVLNGKPMAPHLGIDIAAPEMTPIHAAADGIVSITDDFFIEGGTTLLDHGHGVSTSYLHQSERRVAVGDNVKRGDLIGLVGKTGRATGPHLHWGLAWFQVKLDPSRSTRTPDPPAA